MEIECYYGCGRLAVSYCILSDDFVEGPWTGINVLLDWTVEYCYRDCVLSVNSMFVKQGWSRLFHKTKTRRLCYS